MLTTIKFQLLHFRRPSLHFQLFVESILLTMIDVRILNEIVLPLILIRLIPKSFHPQYLEGMKNLP